MPHLQFHIDPYNTVCICTIDVRRRTCKFVIIIVLLSEYMRYHTVERRDFINHFLISDIDLCVVWKKDGGDGPTFSKPSATRRCGGVLFFAKRSFVWNRCGATSLFLCHSTWFLWTVDGVNMQTLSVKRTNVNFNLTFNVSLHYHLHSLNILSRLPRY